jgi:hypothetical protein
LGSFRQIQSPPLPRPLRLIWIIPQGLVERSAPTATAFQPLMRFLSLLPYGSWDELGGTEHMVSDPLAPVRMDFDLSGLELARFPVEGL